MYEHKIAIIGVGYVGLPLLEAFSINKHNEVIGYDISEERINDIRHKFVDFGIQLLLTSNVDDIASSNVYVVTVPTPIDKNNKPNLICLSEACSMLGSLVKKNDIIIFESTVYPTMTEDYCIPIIESKTKLQAGKDFLYGFSPERINIGDPEHTIRNSIKIVAGCDKQTTIKIAEIYKSIPGIKVKTVASIKVAEAAKLMENSQRDLLIAFANEYSEFCTQIGININDVIVAASTKWNFSQVYPGLVGGHCISVDPYYLLQKAFDIGLQLPLVSTARIVNENKVSKVVNRFVDKLREADVPNENNKILIIGFSYKKNCADIRNTKVANLVKGLENHGYKVDVYDPLVNRLAAENMYNIHLVTKEEFTHHQYRGILEAVHHDAFLNLHFDDSVSKLILKIEQLL